LVLRRFAKMKLLRTVLVGIAAAIALLPQLALAQTETQASFDLRHFLPAAGPFSIYSTEQSEVLDHLVVGIRALADYAHEPLVTDQGPIVEGTASFNLGVSMGVADWMEFGVVMPFILLNEGVFGGRVLDDNSVGDLRLTGKATILNREDHCGFGLAGGLAFSVPTGAEEDFLGDGFLAVSPVIIGDFARGPLVVAANLGATFREESVTQNVRASHTLDYKLGARYELVEKLLRVNAEGFGTAPLSSDLGEDFYQPFEWLLGLSLLTESEINFTAGGGGGIGAGVGVPNFRVLFGAEYAPLDPDRDKDGIANRDDECPDQAEDIDGFKDADGCKDGDNDEDTIPDNVDSCPNDAEDFDETLDDDGCPDLDEDGDGINDDLDACMNEPEDPDGFEDADGCPDEDNDLDGFTDAVDGCPDRAEDLDGFEDNDGCPDEDNDFDGLPDKGDGCPDQAEDLDKFEDDDGCLDPDDDQDGVMDRSDACPTEKETINGVIDDDGCPDEGPAAYKLEVSTIELLAPLAFSTEHALDETKSASAMDQVALVLLANPGIKKVQIQGHGSFGATGQEAIDITQSRAQAVLDYLVARGVEASRLQAVGLGSTRPIAKGTSKKAKAANQRIQLVITERRL